MVIAVAGWYFTAWLVRDTAKTESHNLLVRAQVAALSLDPEVVAAPGAQDPTEQAPEYKAIQKQLMRVQEVSSDVRWYYLMVKHGNDIIFTPDSWPASSSEHGQSGVVYQAPPSVLKDTFTRKEAAVSDPYTDEYGDWVSAFVPIVDSHSEVAAVLGMDINAAQWHAATLRVWRGGVIISVLIWVLWLFYCLTGYTRKRHTNQIEELNNKLKVISKMTRHDVANRLLSIHYYAGKALREKDQTEAAVSQVLTDVQGALDTIKKVGMLETDAVRHKPTKLYNIEEVVREVAAKNPDMEIEVGGIGSVYADEALYSVLENLVNNARMHSGVKHLVITIKKNKSNVEVRVADEGSGVPRSAKLSLFTLGYGFGKTRHTGIGLYIVKSTMTRYGGRVWVEDNKPSGCVFVLEFPDTRAT